VSGLLVGCDLLINCRSHKKLLDETSVAGQNSSQSHLISAPALDVIFLAGTIDYRGVLLADFHVLGTEEQIRESHQTAKKLQRPRSSRAKRRYVYPAWLGIIPPENSLYVRMELIRLGLRHLLMPSLRHLLLPTA
jgi:hypothetical protein